MVNLYIYFGFDKLERLTRIVRNHGGVLKSLYNLFVRYDDLKEGYLVGVDSYGNRYYENKYYFIGKSRWVEYVDHVGLHFDTSMIMPQWYGWLHYKTDYIPTEDPTRPNYHWMLPGKENMSGEEEQYMPYSTTKPKIEAWKPPTKAIGT